MNLTCIICSDLICPSSETYTTHCGHLFHFPCLMQWMQQSKTCPQCRHKTTDKNIFRVYLNFATVENGDDAATLQHKLENAQFQLMLKGKDAKNLEEKYSKLKTQNAGLRKELSETENKLGGCNSTILGLKDRVAFFKTKSKENEQLSEEVSFLKMKLKQMDSINSIMSGSRDEVTGILRNEQNTETLAMMISTLKKALLEADKRKAVMEQKIRHLQSDLNKQKKEASSLEMINKDLKKAIEQRRQSAEHKKIILNEKPHIQQIGVVKGEKNKLMSPSVEEKVVTILNSDSPYLSIKKPSTGGTECIKKGSTFVPGCTVTKQVSIFKKTVEGKTQCDQGDSLTYTGLGGLGKEDIFPSRKLSTFGMKRTRSDTYTASTKFRRIAPISQHRK